MANQKNREIRLKSRPVGMPTTDNFELVETAVPTPGPGQVLVRNSYMNWLLDRRQRASEFDRLAQLVSQVACFRVAPSGDPAGLAELAASIESHAAGVALSEAPLAGSTHV